MDVSSSFYSCSVKPDSDGHCPLLTFQVLKMFTRENDFLCSFVQICMRDWEGKKTEREREREREKDMVIH